MGGGIYIPTLSLSLTLYTLYPPLDLRAREGRKMRRDPVFIDPNAFPKGYNSGWLGVSGPARSGGGAGLFRTLGPEKAEVMSAKPEAC